MSRASAVRPPARRATLAVVALVLLGAAALPAAAAAQAPPGASAIAQLAGTDGCVMQTGHNVDHGCARTGGLQGALSVTLSPDDRFAYVASSGSSGVAVFGRDAATGALRPAGCITANGGDGRVGSEGLCTRADALSGAADVAISPDGANAYVASAGSSGVAWLSRNATTGLLTQGGCAKDTPRADRCVEVLHLVGAAGVAVSADGRDVYVAAPGSSAVHGFARDPVTGALTHRQCLSETGSDGACEATPGLEAVTDLAVAPDGRTVYAAGASGAVAQLAREPATGMLRETACLVESAPTGGPCRDAAGIEGANGVAVSPDSRDVYVAASVSEAVASFRAGPDGTLAQSGCIQRVSSSDDEEDRPLEPGCQAGVSVWEPVAVATSADGRTVYAAGLDTVSSYRRDPASGVLRQTGCVEEEISDSFCQEGRALNEVGSVAVTADGRNVYTAASDDENAVAAFGATVSVDATALTLRRSAVRVPLRCPRVMARACTGTVAFAGAARRAFRLRPGSRRVVAVPAPRAVRRALDRRATATATLRVTDGHGVFDRVSRRMVVRRPARVARR